MPEIEPSHFDRMKRSYRPEIAEFLASYASRRHLPTYGDVSERFGGVARGYGDRLGGITIFCRDSGLPLLPVIVVNKRTQSPSVDARLYRDMGLLSVNMLTEEQARCFDFDWTTVSF